MRALITGATGFVGRRLVEHLNDPVVLSRNPASAHRALGVDAHPWHPTESLPPSEAFAGVDAVFHLAGDPVAEGRWTSSKKSEIRQSRVLGTRHLVERLCSLDVRPKTLISASAVGYYGSRGDDVLDESATPSSSFLGQVSQEWEATALAAREAGIRVVAVRIGIVLGRNGGALGSMLPIFRLGLGGRLGGGRQWMPWIHIDDLVGLMIHAATNDEIHGTVNGVSPGPVTNRDFTRILSRTLGRPALFPAPRLALRLALGEFSEVLLASQRVVPKVALESGYKFRYPTLDAALAQILGARRRASESVRVA